MYYILDKIGDGYKVISHHDELTQEDINEFSLDSGFFNLTKFKQNRWCEMWLENDNRVIALFNDAVVSDTHDELEKAISEYKPIIRNKKLSELGI